MFAAQDSGDFLPKLITPINRKAVEDSNEYLAREFFRTFSRANLRGAQYYFSLATLKSFLGSI